MLSVLDYSDRLPILDYSDMLPVLDYSDMLPILDYSDRLPVLDYIDRLPLHDYSNLFLTTEIGYLFCRDPLYVSLHMSVNRYQSTSYCRLRSQLELDQLCCMSSQ